MTCSSPGREPCAGRLETLAGEVLTSGQAPVKAAPQAATQVCELDFSDRISDDNIRTLVFIAEL